MRLPKLKNLRERRLMTMQALADAAGVSKTTIVRIEAHEAPAELRTIRKLAEALNVEPVELMEDELPQAVPAL